VDTPVVAREWSTNKEKGNLELDRVYAPTNQCIENDVANVQADMIPWWHVGAGGVSAPGRGRGLGARAHGTEPPPPIATPPDGDKAHVACHGLLPSMPSTTHRRRKKKSESKLRTSRQRAGRGGTAHGGPHAHACLG